MVVPPYFGWSAGDIIQGRRITIKIIQAFSSANCAVTQFSDAGGFLRILKSTLESLHSFKDEVPDGKYSEDINKILQRIQLPLKEFTAFVAGYKPALAQNSQKP
ncbi:hypothetical protein AJ78_05503 [Emergomyces pasteurianus Ep9510]|uniref:Uncharacterized protein n=1 Tax=Emergomyces pasteurianus Ep9510 TaxID=1447872 RepID=A0A1J9PC71_9EURO|nr:hypothetical protein AJ78_05503 [Emergomyces pasteurianus Ep9510]